MIRLDQERRWLLWDDEDVLPMTRVLGAQGAASGHARALGSILKAASARGVQLTLELTDRLRVARQIRDDLRALRRQDDLEPKQREMLDYRYSPRLTARLFAHQRVALHYMDTYSSYLLADKVGVGKTPVSIMWSERRAAKRILVVCPNSAKEQWSREIERWTAQPPVISILEGTVPEQTMIARRDGWVIAHWESLVHAWAGIDYRPWDVVIADEAHWICNREAKRSQNLHVLKSKYKLALTAHPYSNAPDELWSILHWLYPDLYASYWAFFSMHVKATPLFFGGYDVQGVRRPKLLKWELAPFTLRRSKQQVFKEHVPIRRVPRFVDLTAKGRAEYNRLRKAFFVELDSIEDEKNVLVIPSVLARVTRLRQYLIDPGLIGSPTPSVKYPALLELLDEMDEPPVIFTMFRQAAERVAALLRRSKRRVGVIHGHMGKGKLPRVQADFHAGLFDALVVVTQAGGTALNLGGHGLVVSLDLPWTARDLEQTEGRVDRPEEGTGRLVATTSFRIIVRGSYEERLEKKLEKKHRMFGEVFMNRAEMRALFS